MRGRDLSAFTTPAVTSASRLHIVEELPIILSIRPVGVVSFLFLLLPGRFFCLLLCCYIVFYFYLVPGGRVCRPAIVLYLQGSFLRTKSIRLAPPSALSFFRALVYFWSRFLHLGECCFCFSFFVLRAAVSHVWPLVVSPPV